ncbi:MAG TPA: carboxypeptidase-like regulatory domain-containing protein, partial [Planctomycetota bacterium]|nr:carboxypeptidase-like regulatory domain-containing protein [Planctomycetota bacterium]
DGGLRVATADLMLGAAGGVSGRAFDAQGRPAAGARVQIRNRDADDFFADARTLTDRDGRFAAVGLAPGRYAASLKKEAAGGVVMRMRASIDGEDAAEDALEAGEVAVTVEAGKTAEIELRAPALAALSGVVTEGGRPAPGVSVRLEEDQGFSLPMLGGGAAVTTDERGGFYFGERKPGNYRLYVEPDGAPRPIERTFALEGGRESREDVALPTGSIEGRVVDADGRALPGLTVTAELDDAPAGGGRAVRATFAAVALGGPADADDDASGPREIFFGDRRKSIVTDRDGRFTLRYLAPGAWKVKAAGAGVAPATKDARVEEGRATKGVELTSVRAGAAEVVVDRGGKDVDLVLLEFIGPAGETERSASTDARPARQGGLKPGTWKVRATSPDDASIDASATFEVKAGETAPVRLKL